MTHSNLILVSTAVLVMSAGVVVGRLSDRLSQRLAVDQPRPQPQPAAQQHSHSWLVDQLNLTADQRLKMDAIWSDTRAQMEKTFQTRSDLDRQHDQAIHDLLTPQQRIAYEQINLGFHAQRDDLFKERTRIVRDANDRSRALLDENQQKQWDILTKEMQHRGPMGLGAGGGMGPRSRPFMDSGQQHHHGDRSPDDHLDDRPGGDNPTTNPTGGT
jgi:hypothetical protein